MAELAMSNVVAGANADTIVVTAGAVIAAGYAVYLDPITGLYLPCYAKTTTGPPIVLGSVQAAVVGLALTDAQGGAGHPVVVMTSGDLNTGGGDVLPGIAYQVSGNFLGGVIAVSSSAATWFMGLVGHGLDANTLRLACSPPGSLARS